MKRTMNSRNIARFHRMLRDEVSLKNCSSALNVSIDTLKKFVPGYKKKSAPAPALAGDGNKS